MFISFGTPTILGSFLLVFGLVTILRNYLVLFLIQEQLNTTSLTLLMVIGELLGGCSLYLNERRLQRAKTQVIAIKKLKTKFKQVKYLPEHKRNLVITYLVIFGLSGIDSAIMFSKYFSQDEQSSFYDFILKLFCLVFSSGLCFFILKIKLFRHLLSGIFCVLISFIMANLQHIIMMNSDNLSSKLFLIASFISLGYSTFEVYQKRVMDRKYIEPFRLLFFLGFFGLCFLGLLYGVASIILLYYPETIEVLNIKNDFDSIWQLAASSGIFFLGIAYMLLSALVNIGFVLINYYYSPLTRAIVDLNTLFFIWVVTVPSKSSTGLIFAIVSGLVLQLLGSLIYHEIVIMRFCSCDQFTKQEITHRGKEDIEIAVVELNQIDLFE